MSEVIRAYPSVPLKNSSKSSRSSSKFQVQVPSRLGAVPGSKLKVPSAKFQASSPSLLPFGLGMIWIVNSSAVFLLGAGMAAVSLILSTLIPSNPEPGREVIWKRGPVAAAPAE